MQFVAEPTGHLLGKFILKQAGSGYDAINDFNLFASADEWTSPIAGEVGPDGAVWMIDWYNYIIQHNPIPEGFVGGKGGAYETELRDKHTAESTGSPGIRRPSTSRSICTMPLPRNSSRRSRTTTCSGP